MEFEVRLSTRPCLKENKGKQIDIVSVAHNFWVTWSWHLYVGFFLKYRFPCSISAVICLNRLHHFLVHLFLVGRYESHIFKPYNKRTEQDPAEHSHSIFDQAEERTGELRDSI